MTRADAALLRYRIAGRLSLDERAVVRCAERKEGCTLFAYDDKPPSIAFEMHDRAGKCCPCSRHQPSKRHAWVLDVAIEDFMAHVAESGDGAWEIDGLRKYLPKRHLEHRR